MIDGKGFTTINDKLSLTDAARLIANRDRRSGDDERVAQDRASKRVIYAVKKGKLIREKDGTFIMGNLVGWARVLWPDKFIDLPATVTGQARCIAGSYFLKASGTVAPLSQARKDAMLIELQHRVTELEAEVARLKPDAVAYRAICAKNTTSAKYPRSKGKL